MVAQKKKNNEELPTEVQIPERMIELMGDMSDIIKQIGEARSEDEKRDLIKKLESSPVFDLFQKYMVNEVNQLKAVIPNAKTKLKKKIEVHKNIVKILESVNVQNPKIVELIQKENKLIEQLNKNMKFLNRFYLYVLSIEDVMPFMMDKDRLENEIETLTKKLNAEGILIDK